MRADVASVELIVHQLIHSLARPSRRFEENKVGASLAVNFPHVPSQVWSENSRSTRPRASCGTSARNVRVYAERENIFSAYTEFNERNPGQKRQGITALVEQVLRYYTVRKI